MPSTTAAPPGTGDLVTAGPQGSARDRLLAAAYELFYAEGVLSVGIDRVIARAGVAKASLYNTFGSKDGLIREYLAQRHAATRARILAALEKYDTPRDKLLGVFDAQAAFAQTPGYRGCAFVNASAETQHGSVIEEASDSYRAWVRGLFTDLASQVGVTEPETLARQLVMLYDGAAVSARMDRNPTAGLAARNVAEALVDAATPR